MKFRPSSLIPLLATSAATLTSAHAATVLTGSGQANNVVVTTSHGSRALGTPNIVLQWGGSMTDNARWDAFTSRATSDYNPFTAWPSDAMADGVYQLDNGTNASAHAIIFTPDAGFNVKLQGLSLNDWAQGPAGLAGYNVDWTVSGSVSGLIDSGTFQTVDGTDTPFTFGSSGSITGANGEIITLRLQQLNGTGSYLAMDNLSFDQVVVPEPSAALLGAAGLGAMAMRRRRK